MVSFVLLVTGELTKGKIVRRERDTETAERGAGEAEIQRKRLRGRLIHTAAELLSDRPLVP